MQPQNNDDTTRSVNVPPRTGGMPLRADREAAAQLMRQQIDSIYDEEEQSPYEKTHSEKADHDAFRGQPASDWKQYHTAWQTYYQQYYERYYLAQVERRKQALQPGSAATPAQHQAAEPMGMVTAGEPEEISRDQAVNELRSKLLNEVKQRSDKVRKSRHFMPIVAALTVALLFAFLQYNQLIVAQVKAYVSPGSINPQNIILDPTTSTKVGPEPRVIIPKINVDAPVVYDVPSIDENVVEQKLHDGVVHYPIPGASSAPGQSGNTVILGHSSMDVFDDGGYKFVFVQLDDFR